MIRLKLSGAGVAILFAATMLSAVPASADTAGSGGPSTDLMNQNFTASNGLSSQYHIFAAGVPRTRAVGLLVQFHGDGAFEFKNPTSSWSLGGPSGIVAQAKARGMLTIAALSPDKVGSVTWWEQGSANADYARDLISAVAFNKYDIDTNNIWLVGYSGGAQFITQFFLPKYSNMIHGGGSVVFGGGGTPRVTAQPFAAAVATKFHMHWYTGLNDDGRGGTYNALSDARAGSAYYGTRGFTTTLETPAGVNHDNLPFGRVVGEQLTKHPASPIPAPAPGPVTPPVPGPVLPPVPPIPGPVQGAVTVTSTSNSATLTLNVPAGTTRVTFRASMYVLGTQTGWYEYTSQTGNNVTLTIQDSLTAGTKYYYQVEIDSRSNIIAAGSFNTTP